MLPKPTGRKRSKAYLTTVHFLPCIMLTPYNGKLIEEGHRCHPQLDAAHLGDRTTRRKSSDDQTAPMCHRSHMQLHQLAGPFKHWKRADVDAWKVWAIKHTQAQMRALGWEV